VLLLGSEKETKPQRAFLVGKSTVRLFCGYVLKISVHADFQLGVLQSKTP
jgi:hypothetical protein